MLRRRQYRLISAAPRPVCAGVVAVVLLSSASAVAEERVALVVGNSAYEALPDLVNPEHDARLIGDRLEAIGFDVTLLLDAPLPAMTAAVEAFSERARDADVALLYYAGHGVQIDGHNFLIPVDAAISTSAEVAAEAAALQQVLDRIERAGAESVVVVLDACRDNPLADLGSSDLVTEEGGLGAGMARVERPGMLIAYATAPGQVAYDGTGGNSPFSASLAFFLQEPGLEAGALFRRVRQRVAELTAGAQFPLVTDGLFEAVYLNPPQSGPTVDALGHVNALLAIENPGDRLAALEGFLAEEPQSRFAPLVRTAVEALRADRAVARAEVTGDPANALADWQVVVQAEGTRAGPLAAAAWVAAYPDGRFAAEAAGLATADPGPAPTPDPDAVWNLVEKADAQALYARFADLFPDHPKVTSASLRVAAAEASQPDGRRVLDDILGRGDRDEDAPRVVEVFVGTGGVAIALAERPVSLLTVEPPRHGTLLGISPTGEVTPLVTAAMRGSRGLTVDPGPSAPSPAIPAQASGTEAVPADDGSGGAEAADAAPSPTRDTAEAATADDSPTVSQVLYQPGPEARDVVDVIRVGWRGIDAGTGDEQMELTVTVRVHECDTEAGARFDIQGVVEGNYPNEIDIPAAVDACRAAVARFPEQPRFRYQLGRALEESGDHGEAARYYASAARDGYLLAITSLAGLYMHGRGVEQDGDLAISLYHEAAEAGELYAANALGIRYRDGEGVEQDYVESIRWFRTAARGGHTFAYNHLGTMLLNGVGVDADPQKALVLFEASAAANDIYGLNNIGWMYQNGAGVEQDIEKAIDYYRRAAQEGQPNAPINLGLIYRDGRGVQADAAEAVRWFSEAVRNGNSWGYVHLGRAYRDGAGVDADRTLAATLFATAWREDRENAGAAAAEDFQRMERDGVRALQSALAERGFDPGPIDGLFGAGTRQAFAAYAESRGLETDPTAPPIALLAELVDETPI